MENVKRFMAAFQGFDAAHGQTIIMGTKKNGKEEARSRIIREPLTEELIKKHLKGEVGVGSIPITKEHTCCFGVIDVDTYPLDHMVLWAKCDALSLPAVVCRSKSGGAHIYFFIEGWISAADIRDKLSEIAAVLGYGGSEIFPKQTQLLVERGDVGNFINLPYFDSKRTLRPAYKSDGTEATLDEFLDIVDERKVSPKDFMDLQLGSGTDFLPDWPPCLSHLTKNGIPEGGRNTTLFNVGLVYKQSHPESWKQKLEEHNRQYCDPPISASEIVALQNQLDRKEYFYQCKQTPLNQFCNKSLCKSKAYGIGNGGDVEIGSLSVVLSEPRVWFLDFADKRLELTTEQLQMPIQFQRACLEQINYMPPRLKETDWQAIINSALEKCTEIEVPPELTKRGIFFSILEDFCTGRVQAQSPEEMWLGKPWTEEGKTYFKLQALLDYMKTKSFFEYTRGQIQERIKELNENNEASITKRIKKSDGTSKTIRVWCVPEFEGGENDIPDVEITAEEMPF